MPLGLGNRFAGLKVDDDEDDKISSKSATTQPQSDTSSKKKKKKRNHEADEALRVLAFGPKSAGSRQQKQASGQQRSQKAVHPEEWHAWKKHDEEVTNSMYEQDLENALLESRLEAEQMKAKKQAVKESCRQAGDAGTGGKKKKKKDKPQPMSLDQFKQLPPETLPGSDDENDEPLAAEDRVQVRVPISSQDKLYFDSVASDASKILQKERIQEQYQRAYAHESAMQSKYKEDIKQLQQRITELEASLEKEKKDHQVVKDRNAQYCTILKDGEMKEKSSILMQLEELTSEKVHLTEQLATLTADLEKERSRNNLLKQENEKLKGKHGK